MEEKEYIDYPAAHSMDSGWFALDKNGNLAFFETGEGGALPKNAKYYTGEMEGTSSLGEMEASSSLKYERPYFSHIAPWIARHFKVLPTKLDRGWYALFDTVDSAEAALEWGGEICPENALMVEEFEDGETISKAKGFIGFAPYLYDLWKEKEIFESLPFLMFCHGDWEIPGHYLRRTRGPKVEVNPNTFPDILVMDTDLRDAEEIQLADFYANLECDSWSQGDLRTGEVEEKKGFFE